MHFEIRYEGNVPSEFRTIFSSLLTKYQYVVPGWCHLFTVHVSDNDDKNSDQVAEIESREEYRECIITLYACFILSSEQSREETILHELLHLLTTPLADVGLNIINKVMDTEKYKVWAENELDLKEEGLVQDFVRIIRKLEETYGFLHRDQYPPIQGPGDSGEDGR